MPIYEYLCDQCSVRFDKMQRFSEDPLSECPECGGPVHRVIQPVGVIFKGSGFYVTDNRSKSSTMPPSKREQGASSEGTESSDSSSESSGASSATEGKASAKSKTADST